MIIPGLIFHLFSTLFNQNGSDCNTRLPGNWPYGLLNPYSCSPPPPLLPPQLPVADLTMAFISSNQPESFHFCRIAYGSNGVGIVSQKLYSALTSLQMGITEDKMGWIVELNWSKSSQSWDTSSALFLLNVASSIVIYKIHIHHEYRIENVTCTQICTEYWRDGTELVISTFLKLTESIYSHRVSARYKYVCSHSK